MSTGNWSFKWTVGGYQVYVAGHIAEMQFITCHRGAQAGIARFCLRESDANRLVAANATVNIECTTFFRQHQSEPWQTVRTTTFKTYSVVEVVKTDIYDVVRVELRDPRHKLEINGIAKKFNEVLFVGDAINYVPRYCLSGNTPYTFQQVVNEVTSEAGLGTLTLPFSPETPTNLDCTGTCADVLQRLLCSIGCDLVYNPFTGTLSVVLLTNNPNLTPLQNAQNVLIERSDEDNEDDYGKATVWAAITPPVRDPLSRDITFGTGPRVVVIRDGGIADSANYQIKNARATAIANALAGWYKAQDNFLDKTFFGLVEQPANEGVSNVAWYAVPSHYTHIQNRVHELHWPLVAEPDRGISTDSDTLERFEMTSNWFGGLATATFTNLSEPSIPVSSGILEDPEGIFIDVLGAGGRGLSIRTRYGRHYVIQAKCKQTLTPPASTGACEVYIEGEGVACVITTEAACDVVGGTFNGVGTTCP